MDNIELTNSENKEDKYIFGQTMSRGLTACHVDLATHDDEPLPTQEKDSSDVLEAGTGDPETIAETVNNAIETIQEVIETKDQVEQEIVKIEDNVKEIVEIIQKDPEIVTVEDIKKIREEMKEILISIETIKEKVEKKKKWCCF